MKKKRSLTVVCPAYNEEDVIADFFFQLKTVIDTQITAYDVTILFVLDRSNDSTFSILETLADKYSNLQVILMSSRFGHQMALLAGIDHCNSDLIVTMDSDLQHPPSLIPEMLEAHETGAEIVVAVRSTDESKSRLRNALSSIFYKIWRRASGLNLSSGEADFRLFTRKVATIFQMEIREQKPFLRGLFYWVGFNRAKIEFSAQARGGGKTKYSRSRLIQFASNSIFSFTFIPLRLASIIGFASSLAALIGIAFITFDYIRNGNAPAGWYTITVLLCFFSSMQFLFLGVLGHYIGMIFEEVKNRPLYIIDRKLNLD